MFTDISILNIILTILVVGVFLAGLILAVQIMMMYKPLDDRRKEMSGRREEMSGRRKEVSSRRAEMLEMRKEMRDMRREQAAFREQVAGQLGRLEGLREWNF